jgi:hypothetical protein
VTPSTRRGSSLRIAVLMGRGLSGNGERNRGPPTHKVALQGPATTLDQGTGSRDTDRWGFEYRPAACDLPVEGRRHPSERWMADPLLNVCNEPPAIGLVPAPVELLRSEAELHYQIARQVLRIGFAALFAPQPQQGDFITGL